MLSSITHLGYRFFHAKFTYLLISLMLLFVFRPSGEGVGYLAFWEFWFAMVFAGAVFKCNHPIRIKWSAMVVGVPALLLEWTSLYHPMPVFIVTSICLAIIFLTMCTLSLLYNEVLHAAPTLGSLRPVLCAYFMLGFVFAYMYLLIIFLFPDTLQFLSPKTGKIFHARYLADVIYFSFGNLTTITAGNMAPLTRASESLYILEAIVGQFYVAVLLAKIINLYSQNLIERNRKARERAKEKAALRRRRLQQVKKA